MNKGRVAVLAIAGVGIGGFFAVQAFVDHQLDRRVERFIAQLPAGTSVTYGTAAYGLLSGKVKLSDVALSSASAGEARIAEVTLASFDKSRRVPHYVTLEVRGFEITAAKAKPATRAWLERYGYKRVVLDIDYVYRYDQSLRQLHIERARISGPNVGTLEISARVGNVTTLDASNWGEALTIAAQSVVRSGRISYVDKTLTNRALRDRAKQVGQSEAAYRADLIAGIDKQMRTARSAALRRQLQHIRAFVEKPGAVRIDIAPKRAVPVFMLYALRNSGLLHSALGVTITTQANAGTPSN